MTTVVQRNLRSTRNIGGLGIGKGEPQPLATVDIPYENIPPQYQQLLKAIDLGMPPARRKGGGATTGGRGAKKQKQAQAQTQVDGYSSEVQVPTVNGNVTTNGKKTKGTKKGKRKAADFEEDAGFQFSIVASKPKKSKPSPVPEPEPHESEANDASLLQSPEPRPVKKQAPKRGTRKATKSSAIPRRTRSSLDHEQQQQQQQQQQQPNGRTTRTTTRRLRSSIENEQALREEPRQVPTKQPSRNTRNTRKRAATPTPTPSPPPQQQTLDVPRARGNQRLHTPQMQSMDNVSVDPTPQKISLPFADTPVMRKNKEMRMKASKKSGGQRRSSLGMRGRRASTLIESGASNALPHDEVQTAEFYKHIEGEGLPEPKRMRQLLIWCATRAMAEKPQLKSVEDQGAALAARAIQDEILKEFSNKSELSDWFTREETESPRIVVKKPNPKNIQNNEKIKELEVQIERLRKERESLKALLNPPIVPEIHSPKHPFASEPPSVASTPSLSKIDASILDATQQKLLATLSQPLPSSSSNPPPQQPSDASQPAPPSQPEEPSTSLDLSISSLTNRLSRLTTSLIPTLDTFASGIHDVDLYRQVGHETAGKVLGVCARGLDARDRARKALSRGSTVDEEEDEEARDELVPVLGALSRVE
ncbi:hypothetical protein KEM55_008104 [Ascosphaera atra]|nr:hypothetical protein KEM55_008104 [Ascosphaera atra]